MIHNETKTLLADFPYISLRASLVCDKGGMMPKYKTSAIRGIIGRILRRHVCHDLNLACQECEYSNACVYSWLFDSPRKMTDKLGIGGTVPHPYIIRCSDERVHFVEGQTLTFEVVLLGHKAAALSAHLLYALEEIERFTFGKEQLLFHLHDVRQVNYQEDKVIFDGKHITKPSPSYFTSRERDYRIMLIRFQTPCRMMRKGAVLRQFSLPEFLWQLKQRVYQLYLLHHETEIEKDWLDALPAISADTVEIKGEKWEEVARYSLRQQKKIWLGGIKATVELKRSSELDAWLPLLQFGEAFHVGKATTFGLGQYELWFK
jgi:hypothetical protein